MHFLPLLLLYSTPTVGRRVESEPCSFSTPCEETFKPRGNTTTRKYAIIVTGFVRTWNSCLSTLRGLHSGGRTVLVLIGELQLTLVLRHEVLENTEWYLGLDERVDKHDLLF